MAEILPFWPKAAVMAFVTSGTPEYVYTRALPTNGYKEIVSQFQCDAPIAGDANSSVQAIPQFSNDGVNWYEDVADSHASITQGGTTYPALELKKFSANVAAFMRFSIKLAQSSGSQVVGGTIMITAVGHA